MTVSSIEGLGGVRVLVCGGRHFEDGECVSRVLDSMQIACLIEGGARGADTLANNYAAAKNIRVETYPANWGVYGKMAGPIRNADMLAHGKPDIVIAFPGGKGTQNMIAQAKKAGVQVRIIEQTPNTSKESDQ